MYMLLSIVIITVVVNPNSFSRVLLSTRTTRVLLTCQTDSLSAVFCWSMVDDGFPQALRDFHQFRHRHKTHEFACSRVLSDFVGAPR